MNVIATIAMKCPNMKSHFDLKWFKLGLVSYLINLQWDDCYSDNYDEMTKYKSHFDLNWFELGLLSYLINLQWDDCYSNNCDEMSKFEVSIWSKMVWVRASVISYKSSMRWMLLQQLRWNVQIRSLNLIQNGLS